MGFDESVKSLDRALDRTENLGNLFAVLEGTELLSSMSCRCVAVALPPFPS
jgi:hypothetical protein